MQKPQFDHKRFYHVKLTRSSSVVYSEHAWFVTTLPSKFSPEHDSRTRDSNVLEQASLVDEIDPFADHRVRYLRRRTQ